MTFSLYNLCAPVLSAASSEFPGVRVRVVRAPAIEGGENPLSGAALSSLCLSVRWPDVRPERRLYVAEGAGGAPGALIQSVSDGHLVDEVLLSHEDVAGLLDRAVRVVVSGE